MQMSEKRKRDKRRERRRRGGKATTRTLAVRALVLKAVQQLHAAHAVVRVAFLNLLKDLNLIQRRFCVVLGALHDLQRDHIVRFAAMWRLRK